MHPLRIALVLCLAALAVGCKKKSDTTAPADAATAASATEAKPDRPAMPERPQVPAPPDVAAAPADAQKTKGGISYKVLQPGKEDGAVVGQNDLVSVNFTVWTTNGDTKHSTTFRNKPDQFPLGAIPMRDVAEIIIGMKVGEKRRAWVPAELAFSQPNSKAEALTYEVEVVETKQTVETPKDLAAPATAKPGPGETKFVVLTKGKGGDKPAAHDQVKLLLSEWTGDGRLRRSTSFRNATPAQMAVKSMPPGLKENIQEMTVGEKRHVWFSKEGESADNHRLYEVELVEVMKMPPPPDAPKDVAKPPGDAKKTDKGVFYKVLKEGNGKDKPKATDDVTVHYSGWTTDGQMFDSSVTRGQPASFNLGKVIPGWTDGLQTMSVGGKTRFWIPEELAYKGRSGPQGMLVFDVELIAIK